MSVERTIHCRECGTTFNVRCSYTELPVQCEECKSYDTYSEVCESIPIFRNGGVGWAGRAGGFHKRGEIHIDLGECSPREKREARELQRAHAEGAIHKD